MLSLCGLLAIGTVSLAGLRYHLKYIQVLGPPWSPMRRIVVEWLLPLTTALVFLSAVGTITCLFMALAP